MAIRNIVKIGDEVLRKKSFPVSEITDKTRELLDDMKETLIKSNGVGLAAPQVGVLRRIFIVLLDDKYFEFINPVIVEQSGSHTDNEGCLSVPGKIGQVKRPYKLTVQAQDRFGNAFSIKASGLFARVICHEYDHLDGILYIDKAKDVQEDED